MTQKLSERVGPELEGLSPLLDLMEAGLYLRKSKSFVRQEVYAGKLPIRRIGRTPYIHRADLDAYLDAQMETGEAAQRPEMTPRCVGNRQSRSRSKKSA